ncbi:hypothetical protein F2P81_006516 [Scophthalmus maximus]|uniref:Uncharacterized protein n=1 Tax=Scophthalmus maximus TaxID=52904 RepID=A0A6A4T8D8_SCOMX|nr:hypothetical protein F2P81_006516 [Scophthalmus maximus]
MHRRSQRDRFTLRSVLSKCELTLPTLPTDNNSDFDQGSPLPLGFTNAQHTQMYKPGPLMKLGVSGSVRLIGQVCPGLRLPVIEVSSEGPLCGRRCTLLRSTPTAKTLTASSPASP